MKHKEAFIVKIFGKVKLTQRIIPKKVCEMQQNITTMFNSALQSFVALPTFIYINTSQLFSLNNLKHKKMKMGNCTFLFIGSCACLSIVSKLFLVTGPISMTFT
jgi:hypothetical protein